MCDVETIRSFIIASSTWSFKCVKCIAVCNSTQFPVGLPVVYGLRVLPRTKFKPVVFSCCNF